MHSTTARRRWSRLIPVVAATAALALVGCSSSENPEGSGTDSPASGLLPDAEGTTQYPLTVDTWAGDFVIAERPERVAVIGFNTGLDALQALDVTPVYALTEDPVWEWRDTDYFSQIEFVDGATRSDPVNFENIANTNPDVIISLNYGLEQTDVDRLTDIAPYVDLSTLPGDKADWREGQRIVGEVLDLRAASEAVIDEADRRIADVAAAHPEYEGKTVTIATDYGADSGIDYYSVAGGTAESFMTDLGFIPNPIAAEFTDDPAVGDEALEKLDGDILIVSYFDDATQQARESSGLFQRLPPVVDGRYHAVNDAQPNSGSQATWVLRRGASALSLPWAAETISDIWLADVVK
ncbi:ABC transporter substrate-binding protein [Rhodococcus sp. 14-2470-1a]|uniref:ABC transporter substrate-binding protein n=1 Tax=Rhodococcus sp. 14-2470-1a TaxID=2023150 RepID=UPI000B9B8089|nr:ABC transporter substrate-binding protein [Rhodococcus sp. 14-2470-1a]OZF50561.1 iron-siderophore ABC transporter substrate-binding protein [Rhodococcus sp. 14-2470-1a]